MKSSRNAQAQACSHVCPLAALTFFAGWILVLPAFAGWVQDGSSLNLNISSSALYVRMTVIGATPYVAWAENNGVAAQILVKHYSGGSWSQDGVSLNEDLSQDAFSPNLANDGVRPYAAWREVVVGVNTIYVKHYNGAAWIPDGGSLNVNANQIAFNASIAVLGTTPYVTWNEFDNLVQQIYVKHYNGSDWVPDGGSLNVNASQQSIWPRVALAATTPYVAFQQWQSGAYEIFVKHFNGSSWMQDGPGLNLDANLDGTNPSLAIAATTPYVAWREGNAVTGSVFVKHYAGGSWVQDGANLSGTSNANSTLNIPTLALTGTTPYVAWAEPNGAAGQVVVKRFISGAWQAVGGSLNINSGQMTLDPYVVLAGTTPFVGWKEFNGSDNLLWVKHFEEAATGTPTPIPAGPTPLPADIGFTIAHALVRPGSGEAARLLIRLPQPAAVNIVVYDLAGRKTAVIFDGSLAAGAHTLEWDGAGAGAGTYLVYFKSGGRLGRGKVVVVR